MILTMYQQREREGRVDRSLPCELGKLELLGQEIGDGTAGIMKMIVARARAGRAANQNTSGEKL